MSGSFLAISFCCEFSRDPACICDLSVTPGIEVQVEEALLLWDRTVESYIP